MGDCRPKDSRKEEKLSSGEWKERVQKLESSCNAMMVEYINVNTEKEEKITQLQEEIGFLRRRLAGQETGQGTMDQVDGYGANGRRISQEECQMRSSTEIALAQGITYAIKDPVTQKSDDTVSKVINEGGAEELEGAVGGASLDEPPISVAVQSCLEYGYSREMVRRAEARLNREGRPCNAENLMGIILEMEDMENMSEYDEGIVEPELIADDGTKFYKLDLESLKN